MRTFADQSALAMNNARLFRRSAKGRELAVTNEHRASFRQYEPRAHASERILGLPELLADGLYGALPDKALIWGESEDGKHLLGLINDVLDISRSSQPAHLALDDYSLRGSWRRGGVDRFAGAHQGHRAQGGHFRLLRRLWG
jgi:hypothetical protein